MTRLPPTTPPASAIPVWLVGHELHILVGEHEIILPLSRCGVETSAFAGTPLPTQTGWAVLLDILKDRVRLTNRRNLPFPIGTVASPVKHDVERWLKAGGKIKTKPKPADEITDDQRESAKQALRKLGIL